MAKLAFLGLGQMGAPMATRLLEAGHDLTVWNRSADKAEPFRERGAAVAATPAKAAEGAEVAITMLADPAALEAVVLGIGRRGRGAEAGLGADRDVDGRARADPPDRPSDCPRAWTCWTLPCGAASAPPRREPCGSWWGGQPPPSNAGLWCWPRWASRR